MLRSCSTLLGPLSRLHNLTALQVPSANTPLCGLPRTLRSLLSTATEPQTQDTGIHIHESVVQRLKELQEQDGTGGPVFLRVEVDGGGCSGFQYKFSIDNQVKSDDKVFKQDGATLLCDVISFEMLKGSTVEYEDSLMRSAFHVAKNPNSESTCGCGSSFVAKI